MRRLVYRLGFRPKPGNPFHDPSLSFLYFWLDYYGVRWR